MKKNILIVFCLIIMTHQSLFSQIRGIGDGFDAGYNLDSLPNNKTEIKLSSKTKYTDYKIISFRKDTTYIDTTLTIVKEYKYNFLRKDNFELLAFHNQGQTFNRLAYNFNKLTTLPSIGMQAKHFNYIATEDVNYYEVPTPTTEILYRTGLEQGQILETLFTLNFSRRFNIGIIYKGLRSLGKYRNSLASHGNFSAIYGYNTENERYFLRGHIVIQDLFNTEDGGLTEGSLDSFISDDPNFSNRGRLDVNLEETDTNLEGKRFYFEHDYKLLSTKDSIQNRFSNLKVGHSFTHEFKFYEFNQKAVNIDFFGPTTATSNIKDLVESKFVKNQLFLEFNSRYVLGTFRVKSNITNYNYGYDTILNAKEKTPITKLKLQGYAISFGADWRANIKNFQLNTKALVTPGIGRLSGSNFYGEAIYKKDSLFAVKSSIFINSKSPNFNTILFQSSYDDYNWQNTNFKKINTRNISFGVETKWLNATADVTNIENYTYFDELSIPQQSADNITYLKIKATNELKFRKFALNNTILYQKVSSGNSVFNVPDFVTRNTLYYSSYVFKGNPLFLQTGITFKYFSKYKANAFNPLLNEFTLQNTTEIGYPTLDFFANIQVRRTRIYFKIDNVVSKWSKDKNYFSAPNYPYRDFVIRFGLVWNWFI